MTNPKNEQDNFLHTQLDGLDAHVTSKYDDNTIKKIPPKMSLSKTILSKMLALYLIFILLFYSNKLIFFSLAQRISGSNIQTTNYISKLLDRSRDHNILILLANNAEMRFGGGFVGSVGVVKVKDGKINVDPIRSVYYYDHRIEGSNPAYDIEPEPYIKKISTKLFLRDAGMYRNFSDNAKLARYFFEKESGIVVDDIISFTPELILELLRYSGPVYVKDYNVNVSADNFRSIVQLEVEGGRDKAQNQDPKSILSHLANAVFEKALQINIADYGKLDTAFYNLAQRKQIMAYSTNSDTARVIKSLGIDGDLDVLEGNYWSLAEANIGADKSSPFIKKKITQDISIKDNMLDINMTISLSHTSDYSHYYYEPRANKELYMIRNNFSYYNLTLPANSTIIDNSFDQPDISKNSTMTTVGFYLDLYPLSQTELKIHYQVPFDINNHSLLSYYEKANGAFAIDYEINLSSNDIVGLITTNNRDDFTVIKENGVYKVKSKDLDRDLYLNLSW